MTNDVKTNEAAEAAAEPARTWQPSLKPAHRLEDHPSHGGGKIVEKSGGGGVRGALREWVSRPLVRIGIVISLFILGAIIYDATLNFGSWTERAPKVKATPHKGVPLRSD